MNRAVELFNEAIKVAPHQATGYNNRAQAMRLKGDEQGKDENIKQNKRKLLKKFSDCKLKAGSCTDHVVYYDTSNCFNVFHHPHVHGNMEKESMIQIFLPNYMEQDDPSIVFNLNF